MGALVDRVSKVIQVSDDQIRPIEFQGLGQGLVEGAIQWGDQNRTVLLLNTPAILELARPKLRASLPGRQRVRSFSELNTHVR